MWDAGRLPVLFDYPEDERLDISDAYCFAGASDARGPRTVFGMNAPRVPASGPCRCARCPGGVGVHARYERGHDPPHMLLEVRRVAPAGDD
jgi:hypothetical protein